MKAIVFDFDGLIMDTETPCYDAFREVYREYGVDLPLETFAQCIGTSNDVFNPVTYLSECLGRLIEEEVVQEQFLAKYNAKVESIELRPGVLDYLEAATRLGIKIGLASSSQMDWIIPKLKRCGIADYYISVRTKDHVTRVKPDPELYLQSLEALGVSGSEAIAFEDSLNGLRAAKQAGLHCVVVPNDVTRHLPFAEHDLLLNSMKEKSLEEVITEIENKSC
ncbi:HAD family hydrolase [Paenibacillus albiflavus]|uniref:HAD family hydrolase n=1 Tax=Paenibacillus albiflavus TaxID=2545760 RepID=A0A4R4EM80_9BACL|nr:HAD family hydrolase [Paenibacillus albiflavus]TCZ79485.1 HAD family hydrolase [Paenibacillus albiflavus]